MNTSSQSSPVIHRPPEVRIAKSVYHRQLWRRIITTVVSALLLLLIIYLCFAATILRVIPSASLGYPLVKNSTVRGGKAAPGVVFIANTTQAEGDGLLAHLRQSFTPQEHAVKVKVLAGPYGTVTWRGPHEKMQVDGRLLPLPLASRPPVALTNTYVVECLEGACTPGHAFLLPADNVYGQPLGRKG